MNEITPLFLKGLKIDPLIFTFPFHCRCSGECCNYGVYTDLKEYEKILTIKEEIISEMDDSQPRDSKLWFEAPSKDEDFESGTAVGTELFNNKCVFLDKNGLCSLQKYALNKGEYKWKYKPLYCILFPFTIFEGSFTIDNEHMDRLKTCNKSSNDFSTIYQACREELKFFFGEENFSELEAYREKYYNNIIAGETLNGKD